MKLVNSTEINPIVKTLLEEYAGPEWLLAFLGTILLFTVVMTIICFRYCTRLTAGFAYSAEQANTGCGFVCGLCNGCINSSTQNCIDCGNHYRVCVDTTYECATHTPGRVSRDSRFPERVHGRQLPIVRE